MAAGDVGGFGDPLALGVVLVAYRAVTVLGDAGDAVSGGVAEYRADAIVGFLGAVAIGIVLVGGTTASTVLDVGELVTVVVAVCLGPGGAAVYLFFDAVGYGIQGVGYGLAAVVDLREPVIVVVLVGGGNVTVAVVFGLLSSVAVGIIVIAERGRGLAQYGVNDAGGSVGVVVVVAGRDAIGVLDVGDAVVGVIVHVEAAHTGECGLG